MQMARNAVSIIPNVASEVIDVPVEANTALCDQRRAAARASRVLP
jgi:hypothetical protein